MTYRVSPVGEGDRERNPIPQLLIRLQDETLTQTYTHLGAVAYREGVTHKQKPERKITESAGRGDTSRDTRAESGR